ncbi:hypothetical protein DD237_000703 [Peronospora effusa]|uniref:Centrosomal protein of 70 kDa n=1 Tax=Peronospora effusa TaxID=542832 RepID=A0A425CKY8_9STRA|nr:hypothetical protein DD237_000703 [Peronospora effusa]
MEDDESLSSVDQFLRDNGFSISDTALGLTSFSGDEVLDDELLLSDAEERHISSFEGNSTNQSPRFVLLEDEGLLLEQQDKKRDSNSNQDMDTVDDRLILQEQYQYEQGLLDRSGFFRGSELSQSYDTLRMNNQDREMPSVASVASSSSSASLLMAQQLGEEQDLTLLSSGYQMIPQQKEMEERVTMVSAASSVSLPPSLSPSFDSYSGSSVSSGRGLDNELSDALGVPRSLTGVDRLSLLSRMSREEGLKHRKRTADDQDRQTQQSTTLRTSRTQRGLVADDGDIEHSIKDSSQDEHAVKSMHSSDGQSSRQNRPQSDLDYAEADEKKEDNDDKSTRYTPAESEQNLKREDAVVIDQGAWNGLNDLLRKNGLPAVRFHSFGSKVLPDQESLFSVIHDFGVQLEHKNSTIEDLVLASQRNSKVRSRRESELQAIEMKNEETLKTLEKAKAEIQRLKASQKKENESAELLSKKLKNSCLRLQQQLKVSEHRVKAKEIIIEKMQTKLQQQVDKDTLNKMRDRRAFRNLQDRDPRRANPRDSQTLDTIGVYEAQREQMQEEIDYLKSQVAALNSELRDKDNFIARQARASLNNEPPAWERCLDESNIGRVSVTQSRLRNNQQHESSSVASDEVMLEQLEAARREQEVTAAKLRHREAVMVEKVAMIEQELLAARETICELKEENANLSLEADSRPSIRDYRLNQRRIRQLERQIAETKLALEETSDLNELRKYMGTKELVKRDRLTHGLHLSRLDSLPRETTLEVVKHVCRVLHLTDITLIAPSLDKICSVVTAVPRMEKFIRDVCGFVSLHLNDNADISSVSFELEQVIPTLQQWAMERRKLYILEEFKTSVLTELCKRTVESGIVDDSEDGGRDESTLGHPTTLSRAIHMVSELVELEKSIMHHREMYTQAAAEVEVSKMSMKLLEWLKLTMHCVCSRVSLQRRPNVLINQIVKHFSHVFQVKNIEGVLPKINEIYLQVNEIKNFLHATRDVLHLRKNTSLVLCLNVIKERLQEGAVDATRFHTDNPRSGDTEDYVGKSQNYVVEKIRSPVSARDRHLETDLVGVQQVRRMSILIRKLKRELGATTMDDILPQTKRLMELLSMSSHHTDPEDDNDYE